MNKISTYEDLIAEEQRLLLALKNHESAIKASLASMKENIEPLNQAYQTVTKVFTRDNEVPFFNVGLEFGVDMLLRKVLLARAGWIAKVLVPYIVKNYSSHLIGAEKRKAVVDKVGSIFKFLRPKSRKHSTEESTELQPAPEPLK